MWEYRNPIKSPLILLTVLFGYSFLAGVFGWETEQGALAMIGFGELIAIIWMWVVYNR